MKHSIAPVEDSCVSTGKYLDPDHYKLSAQSTVYAIVAASKLVYGALLPVQGCMLPTVPQRLTAIAVSMATGVHPGKDWGRTGM